MTSDPGKTGEKLIIAQERKEQVSVVVLEGEVVTA
jgi:hypothetical protein